MFLMRAEGKGLRAIGRVLHRDPGTISRELKGNTWLTSPMTPGVRGCAHRRDFDADMS
jgi:hypothetical protein